MTASVPAQKSRILSARRLVLLASVAGLGVTVLLGGAGLLPQPTSPALIAIAYAQGVQRPMGFADIVDKVKPAVMSVRVKSAGGAKMMGFEGDLPFPPNSQMERFFRRFGLPEGATPEEPRAPRNRGAGKAHAGRSGAASGDFAPGRAMRRVDLKASD